MHMRRRVGRGPRKSGVLLHGCRKRGGKAALFYAPAGTRVHDRRHPGHRTHAGGPAVIVHGADAGVQRRVCEPARAVGDHRDHGHDALRGNSVVHLDWSRIKSNRIEGEDGRDNKRKQGVQVVERNDKDRAGFIPKVVDMQADRERGGFALQSGASFALLVRQ